VGGIASTPVKAKGERGLKETYVKTPLVLETISVRRRPTSTKDGRLGVQRVGGLKKIQSEPRHLEGRCKDWNRWSFRAVPAESGKSNRSR